MKVEFKIDQFREDIILNRQLKNRLTLRKCALQIGISAPTLSRLETSKMPDILTYAKVCYWLKKDLNTYLTAK